MNHAIGHRYNVLLGGMSGKPVQRIGRVLLGNAAKDAHLHGAPSVRSYQCTVRFCVQCQSAAGFLVWRLWHVVVLAYPVVDALVAEGLKGHLAEARGVAPVRVAVLPQLVVDELVLQYPGQQGVHVAAVAPAGLNRPRPVESADQGRGEPYLMGGLALR